MSYMDGDAMDLPFNKFECIEWDRYGRNCYENRTAPIRQFKDCLVGIDERLDLSFYMPRSIGMQVACIALQGPPLIELTEVDLSYSPLDASACESLRDYMEQCSILKKLDLSHCKIGFDAAKVLEDGFSNSVSITHLNLCDCALGDAGGGLVVEALIENQFCEYLDLSHNQLQTKSCAAIGNLLRNNTTLHGIELGWNDLSTEEECIVSLVKSLLKNSSLKKLGISWNALAGNALGKMFQKVLNKNSSLMEIDLRNNLFAGEEILLIGKGLRKSKSMKTVHLEGNEFTDEIHEGFLKTLAGNTVLKEINLGHSTWLPWSSLKLIEKTTAKNAELKVTFAGVAIMEPPKEADFSAILVDRCKFLGMKPKQLKLKRNMGDFFQRTLVESPTHCAKGDFGKSIEKFQVKLDNELINQMAENWTESIGKKQLVALHKMADFYLMRHPMEETLANASV